MASIIPTTTTTPTATSNITATATVAVTVLCPRRHLRWRQRTDGVPPASVAHDTSTVATSSSSSSAVWTTVAGRRLRWVVEMVVEPAAFACSALGVGSCAVQHRFAMHWRQPWAVQRAVARGHGATAASTGGLHHASTDAMGVTRVHGFVQVKRLAHLSLRLPVVRGRGAVACTECFSEGRRRSGGGLGWRAKHVRLQRWQQEPVLQQRTR